MAIPKIPPSAAKLFKRKRTRRQVVVDSPVTPEETLDRTVQDVKIPETDTASASPKAKPVSAPAQRRRG